MDQDQVLLLNDQCDSPPMQQFPLPVSSWAFAFTCCANYPSSNQWEQGGGTNDETYRRPIQNGTAVYVTPMVPHFASSTFQALPSSYRITLVSGSHDSGQPLMSFGNAAAQKFLSDPRLHRWYVQNYDLIGCRRDVTSSCSNITDGIDGWTSQMIDKVRPLPVGLDLHTGTSKSGLGPQLHPQVCNQRTALQKVRCTIPSLASRPNTSLYAFGPGPNNGWPGRTTFLSLADKLYPNGPRPVFFKPKDPRVTFWPFLVNHSFSISPTGAGMDCHRTWEILLLKTVPIVLKSSLSPLYQGLPVIQVDDWEEVFVPGALDRYKQKIVNEFGPAPFLRVDVTRKLTAKYWRERINDGL